MKAAPTTMEATSTAYLQSCFMKNQRHPMDDITGRSACEILTHIRNMMVVVAYGVAETPTQWQIFLDVDFQLKVTPKLGWNEWSMVGMTSN
jgi:hypothetical protein